jgi:hypothetical protein
MRQTVTSSFVLFNVKNFACSLLMLSLITSIAHGQYVRLSRTTLKQLEKDGVQVEKLGNPLKLGVSIGYNAGTKSLYNTSISPVDYTVQFEKVSPLSVVLSTAVMFNWKTFYVRKKKDINGEATFENTEGPVLTIPSRWSIGAVVNFAQFSAQDNLYNQKIDGGLGIGYEFNENIFVIGTFEFLSVKQPRDYFVNQYKDKNKQLLIEGSPLKTLNYDDKNIFTDKYVPAISLKLVFGLALTKRGNDNANAGLRAAPQEK